MNATLAMDRKRDPADPPSIGSAPCRRSRTSGDDQAILTASARPERLATTVFFKPETCLHMLRRPDEPRRSGRENRHD